MIFDPFIKKKYFALHRHLFRFTALLLGIIKFIYFLRICRTFCTFLNVSLKCFGFWLRWLVSYLTWVPTTQGLQTKYLSHLVQSRFNGEREHTYIQHRQDNYIYGWGCEALFHLSDWKLFFFFFFHIPILHLIFGNGSCPLTVFKE